MANTASNIKDVGTIVAKVGAKMLADKLQFLKSIDVEPASSFGTNNDFNVGDTININIPARFSVGTNANITSTQQDIVEQRRSLTLDTRAVVATNMTSAELQNQLKLKLWMSRVLDEKVSAIAQYVESNFLNTAKNTVYNTVGSDSAIPGSAIFDTDTILQAREKIKINLAPSDDNLYVLLGSKGMRSAVNARKGLFQNSSEVASQYKNGYMGQSDGFTFLENNLVPTHSRGTQVKASITVTTTSVEGASTLALTGGSGQTLKAGDVITIANVFMVHPITKVVTPDLQQFVVTADNTASGTAYTGVQISPAIYTSTSGGLQNVNSLPQSTAAVTLWGQPSSATPAGNYQTGLAFHRSAFRFVSVPLPTFDGTHNCSVETVDDISLRVWMDTDIRTDQLLCRVDFLGGFRAVRPEWACKLPF